SPHVAGKTCQTFDAGRELELLLEVWRGEEPSRASPKTDRAESGVVAGVPRAMAGGAALGHRGGAGGHAGGDVRRRPRLADAVRMEPTGRPVHAGVVSGDRVAGRTILRRSEAQRVDRIVAGH